MIWSHLYEVPKVLKFTETEGTVRLPRGVERRKYRYCLMGMVLKFGTCREDWSQVIAHSILCAYQKKGT